MLHYFMYMAGVWLCLLGFLSVGTDHAGFNVVIRIRLDE